MVGEPRRRAETRTPEPLAQSAELQTGVWSLLITSCRNLGPMLNEHVADWVDTTLTSKAGSWLGSNVAWVADRLSTIDRLEQ